MSLVLDDIDRRLGKSRPESDLPLKLAVENRQLFLTGKALADLRAKNRPPQFSPPLARQSSRPAQRGNRPAAKSESTNEQKASSALNMGKAFKKVGKKREAVDYFKKAIEFAPGSATAADAQALIEAAEKER